MQLTQFYYLLGTLQLLNILPEVHGSSLSTSFLYGVSRELQDSTSETLAQEWLDSYPGKESLTSNQQMQLLGLVAFYYATNGATAWSNTIDWLSYNVNECQWYNQAGADACDDNLLLKELRLEVNGLGGTLPESIGNLVNLRNLYLEDNDIESTLPTQIGELTDLTELNLGFNKLSGSLPTQLEILTNLEGLRLDRNAFQGEIPPNISNLDRLQVLDLSFNEKLNGTVPEGLYTLPALQELYVESSLFSGSIPSESGLSTSLKFLTLRNCSFNAQKCCR